LTWLVTGAAGYIGGHVVKEFLGEGHEIVCFDSLESGKKSRIPKDANFILGNILDEQLLDKIFKKYKIKNIVHLAAKKSVSESELNPALYEEVNVQGTRNLINCARKFQIDKFIFSSSAAVYGNIDKGVAIESDPTVPISVYGKTKLKSEQDLAEEYRNGNFCGSSLRFFNVAGAVSPNLADKNSENLIPNVFSKLSTGYGPVIYGNDYPTKDGTCIRDYVHVSDIARAHLVLGESTKPIPENLNIGTGKGVSVLEVINVVQEILGTSIQPIISTQRLGDPHTLIADPKLFEDTYAFSCKRGIRDIVSSILM
jgi:UDP-glucose 4-epimerase